MKQIETTEDYTLVNPHISNPGKLRFSLCWIYSKVKLFDDYINQIKSNQYKMEEEKELHENFYRLLAYPNFLGVVNTQPSLMDGIKAAYIQNVKDKVEHFIDLKTDEIAMKLYPTMQPKWEDMAYYVGWIYMGLSTLIMLYRSDFANVGK